MEINALEWAGLSLSILAAFFFSPAIAESFAGGQRFANTAIDQSRARLSAARDGGESPPRAGLARLHPAANDQRSRPKHRETATSTRRC